ncbi:MAG: insulinase family protein [Deltaproteobacteria bacterium]|jgi:predicted Zn-dependent peptidase|nr:insulinase family protein [Deltaproteobacteria bacterium]
MHASQGKLRKCLGGAFLVALLLGTLCWSTVAAAQAPPPPPIDGTAAHPVQIPFERFTLPNGLTVILHQDQTQPLVAVHVGYQVGSRDEAAGRTGFAHLFEHLMFMGTERVPQGQLDEWMEREGAWNNAWASEDRTVYYEVGPRHTLPLLLWLEADRMSALGRQITPAKLDAQRKVVRNERRQKIENEPYQKAQQLRLPELLFPPSHPYRHPIIGSHEDLEAATVADVRAFFARWYAPQNACLVVAGDFEPASVRARVARLFGSIPRGAAPPRPAAAARPVTLDRVVRETQTDAVTLPKIVMAWPSPPLYAPGDAELDLLAAMASAGKGSRLYRSLVHEQRIARSVVSYQRSMALGSVFVVEAVAQPGATLDELERAIDAVLDGLRAAAAEPAELRRAVLRYELDLIERMQSLDTRASTLGSYQAHLGRPDYLAEDLARYQRATAESVRRVTAEVLRPKGRVILRILPRDAPSSVGTESKAGAP